MIVTDTRKEAYDYNKIETQPETKYSKNRSRKQIKFLMPQKGQNIHSGLRRYTSCSIRENENTSTFVSYSSLPKTSGATYRPSTRNTKVRAYDLPVKSVQLMNIIKQFQEGLK